MPILLQQLGLPANSNPFTTVVPMGFLQSGLYLQRSRTLSVSLTGVRDTILLSATRTDSDQLPGLLASTSGDLGQYGAVSQFGFSATLTHNLTPTATLALAASTLDTAATTALPGSKQRNYTLTWSDQIAPHLLATLSARRVLFGSATSPYSESAVVGTLGLKF